MLFLELIIDPSCWTRRSFSALADFPIRLARRALSKQLLVPVLDVKGAGKDFLPLVLRRVLYDFSVRESSLYL